MAGAENNSMALFVDFENLALGFAGTRKRFEIEKVLDRLLTKGKILVKKAYADWTRFGDYRRELHESSIELIEIPKRSQVGKNSADIRLCVDALDMCYSKAHLDTFCILSGDSDFSPLVSKLRENGKNVIGVGMKASTSNLLVESCDEFIYYEDIERIEAAAPHPVVTTGAGDKKAEGLQIVMDTIVALKRENKEVLWASLIKDTIKRRKPGFDESYYGYKSWSDLLEDAQRRSLITLSIDTRSGTYVISSFSSTPGVPAPPASSAPVRPPVREFPRESSRREPPQPVPFQDPAAREAAAKAAAEREAAAKEAAARAAAEREISDREAAARAAAAKEVAEREAVERAAALFLSLPADREASEAETAVMVPERGATESGNASPSHSPAGEAAEAAVEGVAPGAGSAPAEGAGVAAAAVPSEAKAGVRRRGRSTVRKRSAGKAAPTTRRGGRGRSSDSGSSAMMPPRIDPGASSGHAPPQSGGMP